MNVAWKRRWFVLTDGQLFYYHHLSSLNPEDTPGDLKGTITIGSDTEVLFLFLSLHHFVSFLFLSLSFFFFSLSIFFFFSFLSNS